MLFCIANICLHTHFYFKYNVIVIIDITMRIFHKSVFLGAPPPHLLCVDPPEPHVHNVQPYTKEELTLLCLPDIINLYSLRAQNCRSSNPLVYLYPDIPKDRAFERFYKVTGKV